ncbi:MAG TPA: FecR domain-containing protein [Rhizomicrobium sp.]|nr:FecR domain-containing protein [Rhizomicrobium sp.]
MSADETEMTAAAWLAREDRGLEVEEALALERWLAADTLNRVAYLRLKGAWRRADRLSALRSPAPAVEFAPAWRRPAALAAIAAALMVVIGGVVWWTRQPAPEQVYATAIGKMQSVRLADGTRMELNTDTHLRTDVTARRRVVTLDSGEAYFDVVHDAARPFTVYAGNRRITDLGTKFSVFRNGDDVRVTVREGRVKVDMLDRAAAATPVVAEAGHMVVAKGSEALVLAQPDQDIENGLSWRNGMLVFSQQTLAEAAEQFNRYNSRKIVVEGAARRIRIGGSFKADNVDVFVLLLHRGFGLSVDDQGKRIIVTR